MAASCAGPIRWRVDVSSGTCRLTMSASASRSSSTPRNPLRPCRGDCGAGPACRSPRRRATWRAMRPKPTSPSVAPWTSTPRCPASVGPVHAPARRSASESDVRRAAARIKKNARSAVDSSRTPGVAHRDAEPLGCGDVDVVEAHRRGADDLQAFSGSGLEHAAVMRSVRVQTTPSTRRTASSSSSSLIGPDWPVGLVHVRRSRVARESPRAGAG